MIWGGEFGRTNYCQGKFNAANFGRDHHPRCFSMWMAGGGIKAGYSHGVTDDYCYNIAEGGVHVHDFHATLLHLLGIDHERLTFQYQGTPFPPHRRARSHREGNPGVTPDARDGAAPPPTMTPVTNPLICDYNRK